MTEPVAVNEVQAETLERGKILEQNCAFEGEFEVVSLFDDFELKKPLLKGVYAYGFLRPSPIQARAIAPCIKGRNVLAQAQSGTGKTATFVISSLQRLNLEGDNAKVLQILVVVPTRELAEQIKSVYENIGIYMNIKCLLLIGGVDVNKHRDALRQGGWHVVIGTPGRITHMTSEDRLNLSGLKTLVLDEADVMLKRGFSEKVYDIFQEVPTDVQVILLSATFPKEVEVIADKFMVDPVKLIVKKEQQALLVIKQFYCKVENDVQKVEAIIGILGSCSAPQTLIFVNKTDDSEKLCQALTENGFEVTYLHGHLDQSERTSVMEKFRRSECKLMVATDVISRGIDIQGVALVINFDLPSELNTYIHRIGRAGRYGRCGVTISLVFESDMKKIEELEKYCESSIPVLPNNFGEYI